MKYFLIGDTHGRHPKDIMIALLDKGFENGNKNHKLVVAGDITDGSRYDDNKLINYLRQLERQKQFIAVKGNHDRWTYNKRNGCHTLISESNIKWLRNLPYQLETEHFYLAHGIWLDDKEVGTHYKDLGFESSWGSPCLIGFESYEWHSIEKYVVDKINKRWKSIDDYEVYLDKPLFIGHFHNPNQIRNYIEGMEYIIDPLAIKYKVKFDDDGQISYGKIHFIASDYSGSRISAFSDMEKIKKAKEIKVKVFEVVEKYNGKHIRKRFI